MSSQTETISTQGCDIIDSAPSTQSIHPAQGCDVIDSATFTNFVDGVVNFFNGWNK